MSDNHTTSGTFSLIYCTFVDVSVKLHVSEWAWLVCGNSNRVLLWRFTPGEAGVRRYIHFSNMWKDECIIFILGITPISTTLVEHATCVCMYVNMYVFLGRDYIYLCYVM